MEHLQDQGGGNDVWLSEDGTAIICKMEYQVHGDQVVGLALPMDEATGLPLQNAYPCNSMKDVLRYVKEVKRTKHLYAIVATPLSGKATPFLLCQFGTLNQFDSVSVIAR